MWASARGGSQFTQLIEGSRMLLHQLPRLVPAVVLCVAMCRPVLAIQTDDGLKDRLQDEHAEDADHWVYNDIEAARVIAKNQDKPMFVTFRCVPCRDCKSFDAEVANGSNVIKEFAKKEFVSVRQVEMKGVDLSQFQFDCDLNWAAMFINADGTVYGRYGTQSAKGPDAYNSVEGLKATMERVLKLHANYPANKRELEYKRGKPKPYKTAMEMPGLPPTWKRLKGTTTRKNCIHCHMIHDAEHEHAAKSGTFKKDMLWRYPLPENIGITIDPKNGRKVIKSSIVPEGSEVSHINGQAITSIADIQWALHNLPNERVLISVTTVTQHTYTRPGSQSPSGTVEVPSKIGFLTKPGWKKTDISWRGSIFSVSPGFNVWCPPLPPKKREALGLDDKQPALEVRWINNGKPGGRAAAQSGLREGDVIIEVAGKPVPPKDQKFQTLIKLNYKAGDMLPLTVLRKGERQTINVKLVD